MKDSKELKLMTVDDAVAQIENNMVIGIGTGSTIELLIPKIAERIQHEDLNITGVCTSNKSAYIAKQLKIHVVDINDVDHVDLAIDGADEVDPNLNLIKGGGGALFREKVIDEMATRFVVLADESKLVDYLGQNFKLPVEIDKFNWLHIAKNIESNFNISTERRMNDDVPFFPLSVINGT
ncbi:ribose 5-phosphate isomerase A, partial [Staphylococcus devriesei]|uniref:ribose 5-phosphate isomerase A n=1 Tax=Staphylococcus devriesei TaxID=586733 RepID=UPI000E68CB38